MELLQLVYSPILWLAFAASAAVYIYRRVTENFDYFSSQGIPGPKPVPFFGNVWGIWKIILPDHDSTLTQKYGKTFGYFDGRTPNLWSVDHNLIKTVFVKDFEHFVNRRVIPVHTYGFRKFLTILVDQEWKDVRNSVSRSFSTGKLKRMSVLVKNCADTLSQQFEKIIQDQNGKFEVKKLLSSFTLDVIARCAFGIKIDTSDQANNPFLKNATVAFNASANKQPVIILPFVLPGLSRYLTDLVFITKEFRFFTETLKGLIKTRETSDEKYNDFVEATSEALRESVQKDSVGKPVPLWSKEEAEEILIGQSVLFLLAGLETTGSALTNIFFMLAKYPNIQERLYNEINDKLEQNNGELNHDLVNNIPYADQVINETLRLLPPALRIERECSRDFQSGNMRIKKGTIFTVPTYVLHRLEEHYPDPEKFDPERWTLENKAKISPYAFLPFGAGPRNCLGMRFAMEEMKFALCTTLKKFRIYSLDETPDNIEFSQGFYPTIQAKPFSLGIELRH